MLNRIVRKVQADGFGASAAAAWHKIRLAYFDPGILIEPAPFPRLTLGSPYGGWDFLDVPGLAGATVICCGVGEDITFDVAFASRFAAKVVIVDPTPRAVRHAKDVLARLGEPSRRSFVAGGAQPPDAYDLSKLRREQIELVENAIWIERGTVRFFPPSNPDHVSHSIVDVQNKGACNLSRGFLDVPALPLRELMERFGLASLELLKLDIEGAEIEVLPGILKDGLRPKQILVEYDGLGFPSARSTSDVRQVDELLRASGYSCCAKKGVANYLYVLNNLLETKSL